VSLAPILNFLTQLLAQLLTLAPLIGGIALLLAGAVLALGNHGRGKEGIVCALAGVAVMLGSQTMAASVHP
jgi:hypothetical protein